MDSIKIRTEEHCHRASLKPELVFGLILMLATMVLADFVMAGSASITLSAYALAIVLYCIFATLTLKGWLKAPVYRDFGWANRVTLLRGAVTVALAALACFPDTLSAITWPFAITSLVILLLDGVDGAIARGSGFNSEFGARFDMELDALLIVILCIALISLDKAGLWVLALGMMRYAFVIASLFWPSLQAPLPESFRRKTVCVWQTSTLMIALLPVVSDEFAFWTLLLALALLVYSFAVDIAWLVRFRRSSLSQNTGPQSRSTL